MRKESGFGRVPINVPSRRSIVRKRASEIDDLVAQKVIFNFDAHPRDRK